MAGNRGKASAMAPVCTRPHLDYSLRKRHLGLLALLRRSLCFAPHAPIAKTNPHPSSPSRSRGYFPKSRLKPGGGAGNALPVCVLWRQWSPGSAWRSSFWSR